MNACFQWGIIVGLWMTVAFIFVLNVYLALEITDWVKKNR